MSLINRLTTWAVNQVLKSSDLNGEFNNITNLINNLDSASTTWTNVKVTTLSPQAGFTVPGNLTFSPSTNGIVGTSTNDSATTGNVGEVLNSGALSGALGLTTAYADLGSLSITAGCWMIGLNLGVSLGTAASVTQVLFGYSTTSGNSATGLTTGTTRWNGNLPVATNDAGASMSPRILKVATTTTYYFKIRVDYSGGTPTAVGEINAQRIR